MPEIYDGLITIRGTGSFVNTRGPLILYDGTEIQSIKDLTPNDIHDVEVIKDGSKAIYGFRGADGVVIITSKEAYEAKKNSGK